MGAYHAIHVHHANHTLWPVPRRPATGTEGLHISAASKELLGRVALYALAAVAAAAVAAGLLGATATLKDDIHAVLSAPATSPPQVPHLPAP